MPPLSQQGVCPAYSAPAWPPGEAPNGIVSYTQAIVEGMQALGVEPVVLTGGAARGGAEDEDYVVRVPAARRSVWGRVMGRCAPSRYRQQAHAKRLLPVLRALAASGRISLYEREETFGTAYSLARRAPIPVVVRMHGPWFLVGEALGCVKDRAFRRRVQAEGRLIATAAGVSAPSSATLEAVRAQYGLALRDAAVVPNPAPACATESLWCASDADPHAIVFVGRFDRVKGGDLMIDAFGSLAQGIPHARLTFAGPDRGLLMPGGANVGMEAYARDRLGPLYGSGRFAWLGPVPHGDLPVLRKGAGIIVVASRYETFGNVVVEAMAQGCPVVAASVGGIPEIVRDGHDGLLFRGGDAADLAAKIELVLRDRELAARLGANAYRTWYDRYRPEVVARQMMDFYEQVTERWREGRGRRFSAHGRRE